MKNPFSRKQDTSLSNKERGGGSASNNEMLNYQNRIVQNKVTDFGNSDHRHKMARWNPIARALVIPISTILASCKWDYVDPADHREKLNDKFEYINEMWRKTNMRDFFRQSIQGDRTHGRAFLSKLKKKRKSEDEDLTIVFRVYSDDMIDITEYDEIGEPKAITVRAPRPEAYDAYRQETITITNKDFILCTTDVEPGHVYGLGALCVVWDNLLNIVELMENLIPFLKQQGTGVTAVHIPKTMGQTAVTNIQTEYKDARFSGKALMIKAPRDAGYGVFNEGKPAVAPDFVQAFDLEMKHICMISRYPMRWFVGAEQGALSAASEDGLWALQTLHETFQKYVQFIKAINYWFDPTIDFDYDIVPVLEFRQTEKERFEAQKAQAEAVMTKADAMKFSEVRNELGYDSKGIEKGDQLFSEVINQFMSPMMQGQGGDNNANQSKVMGGTTQKSRWDSLANGKSMEDLSAMIGVSKPTLYKVKNHADSLDKYRHHTDSIHIDSFEDRGDHYFITRNIFAPVSLPYGDKTHINNKEAIRQFVESHQGKVFDLGIEHEDGEITRKVGTVEIMGYDNVTGKDVSNYTIFKDEIEKYKDYAEAVRMNVGIHVSGDYNAQDIPSSLPGIDIEHHNIKLNNVVLTKKGRCGDNCSLN